MKKFVATFMARPNGGERPSPEIIAKGIKAWHQWMTDHAAVVIEGGGPLGKTKKVGPDGIGDTRNLITGFVIVQAEDHDAAARLFLGHPHFAIFPGDGVEVMECLPVPGLPQ